VGYGGTVRAALHLRRKIRVRACPLLSPFAGGGRAQAALTTLRILSLPSSAWTFVACVVVRDLTARWPPGERLFPASGSSPSLLACFLAVPSLFAVRFAARPAAAIYYRSFGSGETTA